MANEEKHMVYSAVLVPNKQIYRRNEDGDEYYIEFSKESIEKMSQDFMREYRQAEITVDHMEAAPEVTVVESWIKASMTMDKSVALGLNPELPIGTWLCGMKVNNVEVWDRVKKGELKGFSVESLISLEEFNKQENNENMETNDEMLVQKIKNAFKEVLASLSLKKQEADEVTETKTEIEENKLETAMMEEVDVDGSEATKVEHLEEVTPTVEEPTPEPKETPSEPSKVEEPTVVKEEPKEEVVEAPEEPKSNPLEDLVKTLTEEIKALKESNDGLQKKVKELGKLPSANPVNTNKKPSAADTYAQWRSQMAQMLGY